jgi:hypothetical protein
LIVKYLFLLWEDESAMPRPGDPKLDEQLAAYGGFYEDASAKGVFQTGDPLQASSSGKSVRLRNGSTQASNGPVASSRDQIIGFYVLDCKDDADAVAWAAKIPAAKTGAIEVRPILVM